MIKRLRRNRQAPYLRAALAETRLSLSDFIIPLFVDARLKKKEPIASMPHNDIHTLESLTQEVQDYVAKGIGCFLLFPIIDKNCKDDEGSYALSEDNVLFTAIRALKEKVPEAILMADVALDPYTSHGHDGIVKAQGEVDNDLTVDRLVALSLKLAEAGIDYVAPSDMMDGRVLKIRQALDKQGFDPVGILAYSAKFASSLYGPFRDTVGSSLQFGDKKSYQLSYANRKEALLEARTDEEEGADLLLVKPATLYMDVISQIAASSLRPVGAYHVSGEYAMACLLAQKGQLDLEAYLLEVYTSLKRAGAQFIIAYGVKAIFNRLSKQGEQ